MGGTTLGYLPLEMDEKSLFQAWLLLDMAMHKYTIPHTHIRSIHKWRINKN
jgi:hypothetical protein